jgi:hypothetical protein
VLGNPTPSAFDAPSTVYNEGTFVLLTELTITDKRAPVGPCELISFRELVIATNNVAVEVFSHLRVPVGSVRVGTDPPPDLAVT